MCLQIRMLVSTVQFETIIWEEIHFGIKLLPWSKFCAPQSLTLAFLRSLLGLSVGSSHHKYILHIFYVGIVSMCIRENIMQTQEISALL